MTYFDENMSGANYVYNWTAQRDYGFKATAKIDTQDTVVKNVRIEGLRCIDPTCDLEEVPYVPLEDGFRCWSEPNDWPDGVVPTTGDVEILPGWNMIYDLADSPVFDVITVNGRLTFNDDILWMAEQNLNAKHIFVRKGELIIGTEAIPQESAAKITLWGDRADEAVKMSGTVEAGNKMISNTNLVSMYGTPRSRMARLLQPILSGMDSTLVEQHLDWVAGDKLYFAPTNLQWTHSEYMEIEEYNSATGFLKMTETFEHYHWGGGDTTADYSGVDMRGEVVLLTRNV